MPIKKKTIAAKKPAAKKPAVLGPKAKLMKQLVSTLRNKAKKLGISDVSKRTKENLAQSIMLAEARKKRGTAMGKKATAKKRTMAAKDENRQTGSSDFTSDYDRFAMLPGKRNAEDTGNVYYERRKNRSDADRSFTGLQGRRNRSRKLGQIDAVAIFDTNSDYIREIPAFYEYVREFYDEETGIYPIAGPQEIRAAINYYLETTKLKSIEFDSVDRERIRKLLEGDYIEILD
jgi:hypothetical protein